VKDIFQMDVGQLNYYQGEHVIPGIKFRYAAMALGMTAWGMNVLDMEPGCTDYPEHDHLKDGQEEVYVVHKGSGLLRSGENQWDLEVGDLIRVGPRRSAKFYPVQTVSPSWPLAPRRVRPTRIARFTRTLPGTSRWQAPRRSAFPPPESHGDCRCHAQLVRAVHGNTGC